MYTLNEAYFIYSAIVHDCSASAKKDIQKLVHWFLGYKIICRVNILVLLCLTFSSCKSWKKAVKAAKKHEKVEKLQIQKPGSVPSKVSIFEYTKSWLEFYFDR
jgi:hypothetical protein